MSKSRFNHFVFYKRNIIFLIVASALLIVAVLATRLNQFQPSTTEKNPHLSNQTATDTTNNQIE